MKEKLKSVALGLLVTFIAYGVAYTMFGNPFEGVLIYYQGRTTEGFITELELDYNSEGKPSFTYTYEYNVDGELYSVNNFALGKPKSELINLEEPHKVEVEYSKPFPKVSRIKTEEEKTLVDWVLQLVVGSFIYIGATVLIIQFFRENVMKK